MGTFGKLGFFSLGPSVSSSLCFLSSRLAKVTACWWAFWLIPLLGYCEQRCNKRETRGVVTPLWEPEFDSFGYIAGSKTAGSSVILFLIYLWNLHTVLHSPPFCVSTTVHESSNFSTSSPIFIFLFFWWYCTVYISNLLRE